MQEAVLAALIENDFGKEQILELYLNKVYFGAGLYGAEAAARGYFGKHAADLTLAEGALLAGLVKAPSNYAPTANIERAISPRTVSCKRCSTRAPSIAMSSTRRVTRKCR